MEENKKAVLMGISSNLMFAASNVIMGIEEHSPGLISRYIIYHIKEDPITVNDQKTMTDLCDKVEFRYYELREENEHRICTQFSKMVLCKFSIFNLLKEFSSVLWLDADILVQGDISEIFDYGPLAWRSTVEAFSRKLQHPDYIITEQNTAPNAGVICVSRDCKTLGITDVECYELMQDISLYTKYISVDEMTFGLIAVKHNIIPKELPRKFNANPTWKDSESAVILHSIGKSKFWNDGLRKILYPNWTKYYNRWVEKGGSQAPKVSIHKELGGSVPELIKVFENVDYWNPLLASYRLHENMEIGNYYKGFVQFYLKGINKKIHYELKKIDSKNVIVGLHIEDKAIAADMFEAKLELCTSEINYETVYGERGLLIERSVLKNECIRELDKLINVTFDKMISYLFYRTNTLTGGGQYVKLHKVICKPLPLEGRCA